METSLSSQEHTTWKQLVNKLTAESQEIDKNNHVSKPTSELDKHKDIFIAKLTIENVHTTHQVLQQWQNCTTCTYRFTNQYQSMPQAVPRLQSWRGGCVQAMAGLEDHARICEKQLKWTSLVWRSPAWVKVKHCQLVCTLVMCCPLLHSPPVSTNTEQSSYRKCLHSLNAPDHCNVWSNILFRQISWETKHASRNTFISPLSAGHTNTSETAAHH